MRIKSDTFSSRIGDNAFTRGTVSSARTPFTRIIQILIPLGKNFRHAHHPISRDSMDRIYSIFKPQSKNLFSHHKTQRRNRNHPDRFMSISSLIVDLGNLVGSGEPLRPRSPRIFIGPVKSVYWAARRNRSDGETALYPYVQTNLSPRRLRKCALMDIMDYIINLQFVSSS